MNPTCYLPSGSSEEIERLRPKTPPPRDKKNDRGGHTNQSGRGGKGRGATQSRIGDSLGSRTNPSTPTEGRGREGNVTTVAQYSAFGDPRSEKGQSYRGQARSGSWKRERGSNRGWRDGGRVDNRRNSDRQGF